jgi:hypothetical protein
MPKPNLFIIGAAKAGTTSLHNYLGSHPRVFMSEIKETGYFFDRREQVRPPHPKGYWNDQDLYLELFAKAGDALYRGESSVGYTMLPHLTGVAKRICDFNPDARLIYIMRDPVERTISHYWWRVWLEGEARDIRTAILNDPFYRDVSNYVLQLEPYLELFRRDQLKMLTLEELNADPGRTLRDIFAWLGVDSAFTPPNERDKLNVTPKVLSQHRGRRWLQSFRTSPFWNAVGPRMPRSLRSLGRLLVERRVDKSSVSHDEVISFLQPIQREQTVRLSVLLGRDFPEWKSLYGTSRQEQGQTTNGVTAKPVCVS